MTRRGSDCLRYYLAQAVLPQMVLGVGAPEMPCEGHTSHRNTLTVRPESYRKLQSIYQLMYEGFYALVLDWIEEYIPLGPFGVEDEDDITGERLSVPAGSHFNVPPMPLNRPSDISRFSVWIDQLPLETVQRAIHLVYPETHNWKFVHSQVVDLDKDIFRHFEWKDNQSQSTRLIVAVQPPWVLSPQDLLNFQGCQSFPAYRGDESELKSKFRLWGKIWDLCIRQNCPWFAVSTYNGWVFGRFSQGWTMAFVTPVFECNCQTPTVVEVLTCWTASVMDLPGTFKMPQVRETLSDLVGRVSIPQPMQDKFSIAPSESSWAGTELRFVPSSAGLTATPAVSEVGHAAGRSYLPTLQFADIQQWADRALQDGSRTPVNPSSPTGTESTIWSELTADAGDSVADLAVDSAYHGDWMSLPFSQRAEMFQLAE